MDWVEVLDPQSNSLLYVNQITGQQSCIKPHNVPVQLDWAMPSLTAGVCLILLALVHVCVRNNKQDIKGVVWGLYTRAHDNQWWELYDTVTQRHYYYNASKHLTVWKKPEQPADIIRLTKLQELRSNEPNVGGTVGVEPNPRHGRSRGGSQSEQSSQALLNLIGSENNGGPTNHVRHISDMCGIKPDVKQVGQRSKVNNEVTRSDEDWGMLQASALRRSMPASRRHHPANHTQDNISSANMRRDSNSSSTNGNKDGKYPEVPANQMRHNRCVINDTRRYSSGSCSNSMVTSEDASSQASRETLFLDILAANHSAPYSSYNQCSSNQFSPFSVNNQASTNQGRDLKATTSDGRGQEFDARSSGYGRSCNKLNQVNNDNTLQGYKGQERRSRTPAERMTTSSPGWSELRSSSVNISRSYNWGEVSRSTARLDETNAAIYSNSVLATPRLRHKVFPRTNPLYSSNQRQDSCATYRPVPRTSPMFKQTPATSNFGITHHKDSGNGSVLEGCQDGSWVSSDSIDANSLSSGGKSSQGRSGGSSLKGNDGVRQKGGGEGSMNVESNNNNIIQRSNERIFKSHSVENPLSQNSQLDSYKAYNMPAEEDVWISRSTEISGDDLFTSASTSDNSVVIDKGLVDVSDNPVQTSIEREPKVARAGTSLDKARKIKELEQECDAQSSQRQIPDWMRESTGDDSKWVDASQDFHICSMAASAGEKPQSGQHTNKISDASDENVQANSAKSICVGKVKSSVKKSMKDPIKESQVSKVGETSEMKLKEVGSESATSNVKDTAADRASDTKSLRAATSVEKYNNVPDRIVNNSLLSIGNNVNNNSSVDYADTSDFSNKSNVNDNNKEIEFDTSLKTTAVNDSYSSNADEADVTLLASPAVTPTNADTAAETIHEAATASEAAAAAAAYNPHVAFIADKEPQIKNRGVGLDNGFVPDFGLDDLVAIDDDDDDNENDDDLFIDIDTSYPPSNWSVANPTTPRTAGGPIKCYSESDSDALFINSSYSVQNSSVNQSNTDETRLQLKTEKDKSISTVIKSVNQTDSNTAINGQAQPVSFAPEPIVAVIMRNSQSGGPSRRALPQTPPTRASTGCIIGQSTPRSSFRRTRLPSVEEFNVREFATRHLGDQRRFKLIGSRHDPEAQLSWSKNSLSKPLTRTDSKLVRQCAAHVNHCVLVYTRERTDKTMKHDKDTLRDLAAVRRDSAAMGSRDLAGSSESAAAAEDKALLDVVTRGCRWAELRDEIYTQLCRQTTHNPSPQATLRGWEMMGTCLQFFPPSSSQLISFIQLCAERAVGGDNNNEITSEKSSQSSHKGSKLSVATVGTIDDESGVLETCLVECLRRLERWVVGWGGSSTRKPSPPEVEHARISIYRPSIFGSTLDEIMDIQRDSFSGRRLPWIQTSLSEHILRLNGAGTEGIFRVPGDMDAVMALKLELDLYPQSHAPVLAESSDPHLLASLLKLWFRELREPLVPCSLYEECVTSCDDSEAVTRIVNEKLPEINALVITHLVRFLQVFAASENVKATKMDVNNLSMVMAPNIFRSGQPSTPTSPGSKNHAGITSSGSFKGKSSDSGKSPSENSGNSKEGSSVNGISCSDMEALTMFEGTRRERAFVRNLILNLDTSRLQGVI